VRQQVLAALFGHPERSFYTNELMRIAESGTGAVQRELESLSACGLVTVRRQGNQKHYQANSRSPIFSELCSIVTKTFGVTDLLRQGLGPLSDKIAYAFLYGSIVKGQAHAESDIDVMIVADDLTLEAVFAALEPVQVQLGRPISPTLYTRNEFQRRREAKNPFLIKVLMGEHIVLMGNENAAF
jgi:predicted nucleotidyltransferase